LRLFERALEHDFRSARAARFDFLARPHRDGLAFDLHRLRIGFGRQLAVFLVGNARMVETRIAPRHRVMKPAKIEYGGMKAPCTIRDISVTGAALEISELTGIVPAAFNLILTEEKLKLPCHVVWRREFRIGVAFD
jgi:hypothetical protein